MQLFLSIAVAIILCTLPCTLYHHREDAPPRLRFFGGRAAVKELRALESVEMIDRRWFSNRDMNKHKKCGPGVGSCAPGHC